MRQGKAEKAQASESEDNIFGLAHIRSKVDAMSLCDETP